MAHQRKRFLQPQLNQALAFSPLVGLMGHRQVGKTTLLQQLGSSYLTFDNKEVRTEAEADAEKFIKKFTLLKNCIDECQLVPDMFPALKEHVRLHKKPGQFLLSGSVRFTSRTAIKESLTGRIINLELLPFSISELEHFELPQICIKLIATKNLESTLFSFEKEMQLRKKLLSKIDLYYDHGGLPGICFIRDSKMRKNKILEQLNTILDRDLRLVYPTTLSYQQILDFLSEIAKNQGQPFRYSYFEKKVKISQITQHRILYALESIFLIRRIPVQGGRGKQIFYLEDQAEAKELAYGELSKDIEFESFLYRNIRVQFAYRAGVNYREFQYLTRGGARIPFAFQTEEGILGVLPIDTSEPSSSDLAKSASFLSKYDRAKVMLVPRLGTLKSVDSRTAIVPACLVI